jgi:uncharacterized protein YecE (DUF72 family)
MDNKTATRILVGTSGWNYPDWRGKFYPKGLAQNKWFDHYAGHFDTVEVNATFYRTFKDSVYEKWRDRAPDGFVYVLKAPKWITHRKLLLEVDEDVRNFWNSCSILECKLGLVLLQVAPHTPVDPERLKAVLSAFPDSRRVAVEFRRDKWFTGKIQSILEKAGAVFCSADSPLTRLLPWVTSDTAYIRLHGRRKWFADDYSTGELEEIADLARSMGEKGAKNVYIFFNNDVGAAAVRNAKMLVEILGMHPKRI